MAPDLISDLHAGVDVGSAPSLLTSICVCVFQKEDRNCEIDLIGLYTGQLFLKWKWQFEILLEKLPPRHKH